MASRTLTPFEQDMRRLAALQRDLRQLRPIRVRKFPCPYCGARSGSPRACAAHSDLPGLDLEEAS